LGHLIAPDSGSPAIANRECYIVATSLRRPGSLSHGLVGTELYMTRELALVAATLILAGPAFAADLAVKAPAPAGPLPAQWSGFYLGIHGGYGWGHDSVDGNISPFSNPSPNGGVFGGQAGYNWQYGSIVGGLEVDFSGADLRHSQSITGTAVIGGALISETVTVSSKVDYFGSARARAGFLLTPDWLFYGTAGVGW